MSKLKEKLESLYRLAKLTDEEIKLLDANKLDDARLNEVRTASFLLLHTARTKGVKVKFVFESDTRDKGSTPPVSSPFRRGAPDTGATMDDLFSELFRQAAHAKTSQDAARRERERVEALKEERREREREARAREAREREEAEKFTRPQSQPSGKRRTSSSGGGKVPVIESQYDGVCLACGRPYKAGERVWWVRHIGCSHFDCGYEALQKMVAEG
jgi:hypothetical protein